MVNLGSSKEHVSKTILAAELLAGATGANGDKLRVVNLVAYTGPVADNGDATWTWAPAANDTSDVLFNYAVMDSSGSVAQTATLD